MSVKVDESPMKMVALYGEKGVPYECPNNFWIPIPAKVKSAMHWGKEMEMCEMLFAFVEVETSPLFVTLKIPTLIIWSESVKGGIVRTTITLPATKT